MLVGMRQVVQSSIMQRRDSGKLYLQADAGATESFRRAINESLAFKV